MAVFRVITDFYIDAKDEKEAFRKLSEEDAFVDKHINIIEIKDKEFIKKLYENDNIEYYEK